MELDEEGSAAGHGLAVELASLRAWPALEEVDIGGWRLRFSVGFTKRANSVQVLSPSPGPLDQQVARCESWYAERGAPTMFRLTRFSEPELNSYLSERGYRLTSPTWVLHRGTGSTTAAAETNGIRPVQVDEWTRVFALLSRMKEGPPPALASIVSRIEPVSVCAVLDADTPAVACGLAVLDGELLGLFDLVTDPQRRRQGLGAQLVRSLIGWGRERGATRVYLQVDAGNMPAIALYQKLGFKTLYRYWYRVQGA